LHPYRCRLFVLFLGCCKSCLHIPLWGAAAVAA
jgi:hypothetical protein